MLQRIQSIYLLLAGVAIFALFLFPLAHNVYVDGLPVSVSVIGTYIDANGQQAIKEHFTALTAATAVVGLIPLIIIFLFRNRKRQVLLCYGAILIVIAYSFWMAQTVKGVMGNITLDPHNWGIGLSLCPLSIVLLILAAKGIQRDEKLIKSADRLR